MRASSGIGGVAREGKVAKDFHSVACRAYLLWQVVAYFYFWRARILHGLMTMRENQFIGHTIRSHGSKLARVHKHDWLILLLLVAMDIGLNLIEPFHRYVSAELMTDLKYPFKKDTVPMWAVPVLAYLVTANHVVSFTLFNINLAHYRISGILLLQRDVYDLHHAILGLAYSLLVTAIITDSIKDAVGRPRPNFFYRCFPDGIAIFDLNDGDVLCTGDKKIIKEGYKSFPSGHSSWSFAGLGFLALYLCGKIRVFDRNGHAAKLCIVLLPYLCAALVAISRVDDYWHHWTDVFTGSILGAVVSLICYLQFFPSPHCLNEHEFECMALTKTSFALRVCYYHATLRIFRRKTCTIDGSVACNEDRTQWDGSGQERPGLPRIATRTGDWACPSFTKRKELLRSRLGLIEVNGYRQFLGRKLGSGISKGGGLHHVSATAAPSRSDGIEEVSRFGPLVYNESVDFFSSCDSTPRHARSTGFGYGDDLPIGRDTYAFFEGV
ncbi:Lipid phosphate phosphatase 2 [Sesamum angolense]|uniref:Lipid phosphate phosphatase 2 n=1 Tax=Sesamum angolense TaxID=2727404 RepID=A0AAE2C5C1_9LAMI|nr:Lipid phosphate phosphatase 2 [Sesamum angolense]